MAPDYMNGFCHVYAVALHKAFGTTFLVLLDKTDRYPDGVCAVHHVYAVDGNGFAYDYHGKHSAADVSAQWLQADVSHRARPAIARIATERGLQKYVERTKDGWRRPLDFYTPDDVALAQITARGRLGSLLQ